MEWMIYDTTYGDSEPYTAERASVLHSPVA